ncbi:FAD-dependent oxidoreductase [Scytonema sp. NUACC26]|uniref:FAD-dependent oxidoreductase n=1 Tax=Scytonema sp. NUACC26 TaxID=3140176 RepID=UPI0034DCBBF3
MLHSEIATNAVPQKPDCRQAVVIGGSIAGLLVARVLADYFGRVTVVERDRFPSEPVPRPGVPQSYQLHVLLAQGLQILEQLFPGFKDELAFYEAPIIDWTADYRWLLPGGWAPRFSSEITTRSCSRNLLELIIRKRLTSKSHVEFLEATVVTNLLSSPSKTAVTGVRIRNGNSTETELSAQLVVDASGRNSKAPKWLQALGYDLPIETAIDSFLGYSTRWYQSLTGEPLDYKVLYIIPSAPNNTRGGVLYQVEGNRWIVSLIGVGKDYPPTDEAGFFDFARSLRSPEISEAIQNAQPISPIYGYQRTENRLRHYERMSRLPENFLIVGDAVCAFNPVYGQGMTAATLGALTLDWCLKQQNLQTSNGNLTGLQKRFQKQLSKVNTVPWLMATGDDFRWPTTEGGQPSLTFRFMHWYLDRVMLSATQSANVYKVLVEVLHLLKPPTALFQPSILAEVLRRILTLTAS